MPLFDSTRSSRREFLKTAATSAAAFTAFPYIGKAAEFSPNERINLACCGIGNRGASVVKSLMKTGMFNLVALCDTQMGAKHTRGLLEAYPDVPRFQDFRRMLTQMDRQIDAVSAGVPDHTHFPICMHAMALGKSVYVEKPLAHTVQECNLLMQAEAKYKVACQMGNQGHSGDNYYQFRAMAKAGIMDHITRIDAHMTKGRRWHKWNGKVPGTLDGHPTPKGMTWDAWLRHGEPIPKEMDWDTWLGQVRFHAFHTDYIGGDWRCWFDFGNGALGDWGAHILDTAHEFLDLGMPESVTVEMMDRHNDYVFPMGSTLKFLFPERSEKMPAVEMVWYEGLGNLPELPAGFYPSGNATPSRERGREANKKLGPGKILHRADGVSFKGSSHSSSLTVIENEHEGNVGKMPDYEKNQPDHFMDFALGVRGEKKCNSRFEVSGELSKLLCLGCIAQRTNQSFSFDRKTETIPDNKIANQLLVGPPPRKGWEQYYKV